MAVRHMVARAATRVVMRRVVMRRLRVRRLRVRKVAGFNFAVHIPNLDAGGIDIRAGKGADRAESKDRGDEELLDEHDGRFAKGVFLRR